MRVVVTGMGVVTPIGSVREDFWENVKESRVASTDVTSFDAGRFKVQSGCEIPQFDAARYFRIQDPNSMGRTSQLAVAAARMAIDDAGLEPGAYPAERTGVVIGTTSGEPSLIEALDDCILSDAMDESDERFSFVYPCHVIAAHVAREFRFGGVNQVIPTACAAGNYAIAYAMDALRSGRAEMMLAGGADAFSRITYSGFYRLGAISPDLCRPFDKHRAGMIPGEGSAILILENEQAARQRGARIYAEIAGYGLSCDAWHMTGPHPEGDGAARAMKMALRTSRTNVEDVGYICAHGTGTKASDKAETKAVKQVFGQRAYDIPVSSIKSMLGHTMGAASAIEAVACVSTLSDGTIPPTANWETADPECDLDYVTTGARDAKVDVVMNNAYAFGGNNASIVLTRYG